MLTLKQLRHAIALEAHGNFHRAAKAEHVSQPALSRSIRALEEQLGVPLFERQGATVSPTLFGTALLARAVKALDETDEIVREIQLLQGLEAGSLHIAMGVYAAEVSAAAAIGELVERYPGIDCRVQLISWKDVAAMVVSRAVDLGIGEISTLEDNSDLEIEPLGRHRLVLFCRRNHPLACREELSKRDLEEIPTVMVRLPPRAAGLFPGRTRLAPDDGALLPSVEVEDLTTARIVVANSDGFGIATAVQIEHWLRSGELTVLPFHRPWMELNYGFIHLRNHMLSPAAMAYMQIVRKIEGEVRIHNEALMAELIQGTGRS